MTHLIVKNKNGENIWEIELDEKRSLLSQMELSGIEIPNACRTWMCAACLCTIEQWENLILKDMKGEPAFPLWEEEVMTCIAGVKASEETLILQTMN